MMWKIAKSWCSFCAASREIHKKKKYFFQHNFLRSFSSLFISEYRRENYEPVGTDSTVNDSVSDVIAILKMQANRRESYSDSGEEEDPEYIESDGYVQEGLTVKNFVPIFNPNSPKKKKVGFPTV